MLEQVVCAEIIRLEYSEEFRRFDRFLDTNQRAVDDLKGVETGLDNGRELVVR